MFMLFIILFFMMYPTVEENKKIPIVANDPLDILNTRYVKSEITKEEYENIKRNLIN